MCGFLGSALYFLYFFAFYLHLWAAPVFASTIFQLLKSNSSLFTLTGVCGPITKRNASLKSHKHTPTPPAPDFAVAKYRTTSEPSTKFSRDYCAPTRNILSTYHFHPPNQTLVPVSLAEWRLDCECSLPFPEKMHEMEATIATVPCRTS